MTTIDEAIRELTHVGNAKRVYFAADIGNADETAINWIFVRHGRRRVVEMPRAAFNFEREPRANFWLVNMAEPIAEMYGIADFAITNEAAERHRERILDSWRKEDE